MRQGSEKLNRISSGMIRIAVRAVVCVFLAFVLFRGVTAAYSFGHDVFYEHGAEEAPGRDIRVTIGNGTDAWHTASILKRKGIIDNEWAFRIQSVFFGLDVKPGTYLLNTSETVKEILVQMDAGPETEGGA